MVNSSLEFDVEQVLSQFRLKSQGVIDSMRQTAQEMFGNEQAFLIGVNGSIARREYTSGSDVDLFFLYNEGELQEIEEKQDRFRARLEEKSIKMPSSGGVFESPLKVDDLLKTIGGGDDTNEFITRRMLFLLEGEWIYNKASFEETRTELIKRYVPVDIDSSKIPLFLLNDIIRYWRTICVDFEFKTDNSEKPRAIRLIKLRFSRMLLYFAGIVAVGDTVNKKGCDKRGLLENLLSMHPIERVQFIFENSMDSTMQHYAKFLKDLDDHDIRSVLEKPGHEGTNSEGFKRLSEEARHFKKSLIEVLMKKYGADHELVKALLF